MGPPSQVSSDKKCALAAECCSALPLRPCSPAPATSTGRPPCACAGSTAYAELLPAWQAAGIKVVQVHSEAGKGYVQDVFKAGGGVTSAPGSTGLVLCGHKGMVQDVTAAATQAGVAPEKILLNF